MRVRSAATKKIRRDYVEARLACRDAAAIAFFNRTADNWLAFDHAKEKSTLCGQIAHDAGFTVLQVIYWYNKFVVEGAEL